MAIAPAGKRPTWIHPTLEISDSMDLVVDNNRKDPKNAVNMQGAKLVYPALLYARGYNATSVAMAPRESSER
jgi:hypothetical protein